MSATLGALLRRLEPGWSMTVIERLDAGRHTVMTGLVPVISLVKA